jgi:hypothetical protein
MVQLSTPNKEEVLPVTNGTQDSFEFPDCKRRHVEANFQGGDITSDGRVLRFRRVTAPTQVVYCDIR